MYIDFCEITLFNRVKKDNTDYFLPMSFYERFSDTNTRQWHSPSMNSIFSALHPTNSDTANFFKTVPAVTENIIEFLWYSRDDLEDLVMLDKQRHQDLVSTRYFRGLMEITRLVRSNLPVNIPLFDRDIIVRNFLNPFTASFLRPRSNSMSEYLRKITQMNNFIRDLKNKRFTIGLFVFNTSAIKNLYPKSLFNEKIIKDIATSNIVYDSLVSSYILRRFYYTSNDFETRTTYSNNLNLDYITKVYRDFDGVKDEWLKNKRNYFSEEEGVVGAICLALQNPGDALALKLSHDLPSCTLYEFDGNKESS